MKTITITILTACFLIATPHSAGTGGDYDLTWSTTNAGGGTVTGGDYSLTATIAQPEAGVASGGDYELFGGFLPGGPLCTVQLDDFAIFAKQWLDTSTTPTADLDGDTDVDLADLSIFVNYWLDYCPTAWPLR